VVAGGITVCPEVCVALRCTEVCLGSLLEFMAVDLIVAVAMGAFPVVVVFALVLTQVVATFLEVAAAFMVVAPVVLVIRLALAGWDLSKFADAVAIAEDTVEVVEVGVEVVVEVTVEAVVEVVLAARVAGTVAGRAEKVARSSDFPRLFRRI